MSTTFVGRWRKRLDKWATAILRVLRLASATAARPGRRRDVPLQRAGPDWPDHDGAADHRGHPRRRFVQGQVVALSSALANDWPAVRADADPDDHHRRPGAEGRGRHPRHALRRQGGGESDSRHADSPDPQPARREMGLLRAPARRPAGIRDRPRGRRLRPVLRGPRQPDRIVAASRVVRDDSRAALVAAADRRHRGDGRDRVCGSADWSGAGGSRPRSAAIWSASARPSSPMR